MAELTFHELLNDNQTYPDSMQWTLEDGRQVALGTLRQAMRGFVPQSELENTRRQSYEQQQALLREKQVLEQQLIERLSTAPDPAATVPEVYNTDPLFKPVWDKANSAHQELNSVKDTLKQMQQLQQQMFQTVQQIPVVMHVQKIQHQDPETDGQKLLEFARDHHIQPQHLEDAHKLMTRDRDIAKAREAALAEGFEKAKQELVQQPAVPYAPYGPPQLVPNAPLKFDSEQALEQAILGDMEIQQVYTGQREWTGM